MLRRNGPVSALAPAEAGAPVGEECRRLSPAGIPAYAGMTAAADARFRWKSAALVFPVAPFALSHPFHGLRDPLRPRLRPLRFHHPFDIFAPAARRESVERRRRLRRRVERRPQV